MRRSTTAYAFLAVVLGSSPLYAQIQNPFDISGDWATQVRQPAVLFALQLTDAQAAVVDKALRQTPQSPDGVVDQVRGVLLPIQLRRLEQVIWRTQGAYALLNPLVYKSLRLSDRQLDGLHNAARTNEVEAKKVEKFLATVRFRSAADRENYLAKYRIQADQRLLNAITPGQRESFEFLLNNATQFR